MKTSTSAMNQPCDPSHGNVQSRSTAEIIAMTIVGKSTRKPQKIAACIAPGQQPLEQLPLAEHDHRFVADPTWNVVVPLDRLRSAHEADEQQRAPREEGPRDGERSRERERACKRRCPYASRAFLSSAEIAGTISCRSPITA